MKIALAAAAMISATAAGDEIISTFGHDYAFTADWDLVGQTFIVPESNMLDSIAVVLKGNVEDGSLAILYVLEWDGDSWVTPHLWNYFFFVEGTDEQLFTFTDLDLLLERDKPYIILLSLHEVDPFDPGVAYVADAYEGGNLITAQGPDDIVIWPGFDMLFSLGFTSCPGDFNGDGALNIFDFLSFQGAFTAGKMQADCNGDGMLNVLDFVCFQQKFLQGCHD